MVLPFDKGLHAFHVLVGADDKHFATVLNEVVLGSAFRVVDETVAVGFLHLGSDLLESLAIHLLVFAIVAHFTHFDGQIVVHAESLRHRIVGKGAYHDVLATEVAKDVRRFEIGLSGRIESVLAVHLAVGVRHSFRVDLTAEITF